MIIRIPYGYKPGEKMIGQGFFICPLCHRKRPYARMKITKKLFVGIFSLFSVEDLEEYIQCGGCLKTFPLQTIDPKTQLNLEISQEKLPPKNLFELWQALFINLECEAILADDKNVVEVINAYMWTAVNSMQKAGVSIRLEMINEVRTEMYNILGVINKWIVACIEDNSRAKKNPKLFRKLMQFKEAAHLILSQLPLE